MYKKIIYFLLVVIFFSIISCEKDRSIGAETTHNESSELENELFYISAGTFDPVMILVEGGCFIMGNESVDTNQPHPVELSSFYMAKYMITIGEWKDFLNDVNLEFSWDWDDGVGYGPFKNIVPTDDCPAQGLNWYYAVIFCNWASLKDGLEPCYEISKLPEHRNEKIEVFWTKTANGYRLPTDAEWEYAARGGQLSKEYLYPGSNNPSEIGNFDKENKTSYSIGQFLPNELGIHDMGGNADEWCWDFYDEKMYEWLPGENPSIDRQEDVKIKSRYGLEFKVIRGSSWNSIASIIPERGAYPPEFISMTGIRLVRNAH